MAARALPSGVNPHLEVCRHISDLSDKKLNQPVSLPFEVARLRDVTLPMDFPLGLKFYYNGIEDAGVECGMRSFKAKFLGDPYKTAFSWGYDETGNEIRVCESYRGELPTWVKVGKVSSWLSEERGSPTAQVITAQFCKALDLAHRRPTLMRRTVINAQTLVDIFHGALVEGKSVVEALAASQTAKLAAQFAVYCGASQLHLDAEYIPPVEEEAITQEVLLKHSGLTELERAKFLAQSKIFELTKNKVDFTDPNLCFPQMLNLRFKMGYPSDGGCA